MRPFFIRWWIVLRCTPRSLAASPTVTYSLPCCAPSVRSSPTAPCWTLRRPRASPQKPSSCCCYAKSALIGLVEPYDPGLAELDAQGLFKHGFKHRARHPLSVDVDAARHTGAHRLEKIAGALRDYDDLVVAFLQVPALQLSVGGGVKGDSKRSGEGFSEEFEECYLCTAVVLFHAERVVLLLRHAFSSLTGRPVTAPSAGRSAPTRRILDPVCPGPKDLERSHPRACGVLVSVVWTRAVCPKRPQVRVDVRRCEVSGCREVPSVGADLDGEGGAVGKVENHGLRRVHPPAILDLPVLYGRYGFSDGRENRLQFVHGVGRADYLGVFSATRVLAVHPCSFGFLRTTSTLRHRASYPPLGTSLPSWSRQARYNLPVAAQPDYRRLSKTLTAGPQASG